MTIYKVNLKRAIVMNMGGLRRTALLEDELFSWCAFTIVGKPDQCRTAKVLGPYPTLSKDLSFI